MNIEIVENELGTFAKILFSKTTYKSETLLKVAYSLTDELYVFISECNDNYEVNITLINKNLIDNDSLFHACGKFINELSDQEMRQIVIHETSYIRESIIASAFSEAAKGIRSDIKNGSIPKSKASYNDDKLDILNLKG